MFSLSTAFVVWHAARLRALAFALAALMHPGAERFAAPFLDAAAAQVAADTAPVVSAEAELSWAVTFAHDESDFGRALGGKRWDSQAFGILQVRGARSLETDPAASVREWLMRLHASAKLCGDARALAGIASGRCDRGTHLAAQRAREAAVAMGFAQESPVTR
jgi:hypothetical protein